MGQPLSTILSTAFLALSVTACSLLPSADTLSPAQRQELETRLKPLNVVWRSHSNISRDSMPTGNGDIGLNVWTEENGDLLFYVGKTDAFDEQSRLLKLGRIRVHFDHAPFAKGKPFTQELDLHDATIRITAGAGDSLLRLKLWVDANHPVVHVEAESATAFSQTVSLEMWRTGKKPLSGNWNAGYWDAHAVDGLAANEPPFQYPDTLISGNPGFADQITWFHRNAVSVHPVAVKLQGLDPLPADVAADPLLHRTFGAAIRGEGMISESPSKLKTATPRKNTHVTLIPLTCQTAQTQAWEEALLKLQNQMLSRDPGNARAAHEKWWNAFWNRSDVTVSGGDPKETSAVSLGWHLNRFVTACTARGNAPVKFNGAIFTVDGIDARSNTNAHSTADTRSWGSGFWFQNQRHIYWPMLQAGDYEQFLPFFKVYRDALPMARHRTKTYYQHDGAFFPETMYFWGAYVNENYGWNRHNKEPGLTDNGFIRRYWQGGIEVSAMMLDYHRHTGDADFAKDTLLPIASNIVTFYDQHYQRDAKGKIHIYPAQALESIWDATNPTPEIAGLRYVINGLLALPGELTTEKAREQWTRVLAELPPIPTVKKGDTTLLAHAESTRGRRNNSENVNLYAVWPYRQFGVLPGNLKIAQDSFAARDKKFAANSCWHNDILFAAYTGDAKGATHKLAERFLLSGNCRFPTFYAHGDHVPDLDNGGVCQNTIQSMLMQADDKKIVLLPAWPKEWNASFKLHAPYNTTVEGRVENGKLLNLKVTPESRRQDVEILPVQ